MHLVHINETKSVSSSVLSDPLGHRGLYPTSLPCSWNFSGKNTGVGWHSLLQEIVPTQGSNPGSALQADSLPTKQQ